MSLVAKVFVVLNLVVSVAFLILSMNVWTAQTKWQKMYEVEKSRNVEFLGNAQKRELELSRDNVAWQSKVDEKQRQIVAVKLQFNESRDRELEIRSKLASAENGRDMKDAENQELQREVKRYADDLTKLKGVVIKQQQAVAVERENAVRARNEKSEMENELNVTKQNVAALMRDKQAIETDLALQTGRIQRLMEHNVPVLQILNEDSAATQPHVADATVLAVRPEVGLVMLSTGSQQQVKQGYQFIISRGDQYITKVQVDRVYPDMCSAKVLPGMDNKKGLAVEVHDDARSH